MLKRRRARSVHSFNGTCLYAMKASLVLKMGQQLTMTPQLQQAIRLLQMSTLDLQDEIREALEANPMLERQDDADADGHSSEADPLAEATEQPAGTGQQLEAHDPLPREHNESSENTGELEHIPDELAVDTSWEDIYQTSASNLPVADDEDWDFTATTASGMSLQDHLLWQLNLSSLDAREEYLATTLIDSINSDGYLEESLQDMLPGFDPQLNVRLAELEAMLAHIQQFEPTGVGARDLRECLLLQLEHLEPATPHLAEARLLCDKHLALLGAKEYNRLMRLMRLDEDSLREVVQLIQTLDPRPGSHIEESEPEYIVPDVIVSKRKDRWVVELNPEIAPRLRVNSLYASYVRRADNSDDNSFMRNQLQEARWFIRSLHSRNETLLKVSSEILKRQQGFFEHGPVAMKPMVLADIADAIEMHESTISRATTQKYMHTPRGVFELKYFFSSHVSTEQGGECSSTAIRAMIGQLVGAENPKKPLSDSKITDLLAEQGIQVARRTIAKYREALGIPSSSERKQLF